MELNELEEWCEGVDEKLVVVNTKLTENDSTAGIAFILSLFSLGGVIVLIVAALQGCL